MKKIDLKKINISVVAAVIYWLLFIFLTGMFFTNDFGLVDIHKTSIITAVGVDCEEMEVSVTCEVAVPQPSQSGDSIKYTQVQGSGLTIADALNEINAKTGFYPKLQFCKLILIGENCQDNQLFRVLGCFYRKNYSELTASVAMCKGKASDMLAMQSSTSDSTSEAITKVISDEVQKSANTSGANLKDIAVDEYSKSGACYMPYVEANKPGTSEEGGDGDNVGGEQPEQGESQGGQQSGGSEGGSSEEGGSQSGQSGGSGEEVEFSARKTAFFSHGLFKGILDEQSSFALAVLKNEIRLAVVPCDAEGVHYTIGLKSVDRGVDLKFDGDEPQLEIGFSATAQIQGARRKIEPNQTVSDDSIPEPVVQGAADEVQNRMEQLLEICRETNCDLLGLKEMLYKSNYDKYEQFKDDIYEKLNVSYNIDIKSVN